ncbi:MAG: radical SAM protein [Nitrosarchaeum sp.]|nr:radical SAM protein [Nitrosarchaeum sp.]
MSSDLIKITNSKNNINAENQLKKETGKEWKKNESDSLELGSFDFNKKIFYHPENIKSYKEGRRPFPVTLEVDLTNNCNHRCSFCYYAEHIGVNKDSLDTATIKNALTDAKILGTKGISLTGGGEPMMHKDYEEILKYAKQIGFDVGTITNGSAINERNVSTMLENLQFIRISMAGGDRDSYSKVQGVDQFDRVVQNIRLLSDKKVELGSKTKIGIRTLVTPQNIHTLDNFAEIIKDLNIDHYQLAPDMYTDDKGSFWNDPKTQNVFKKVKHTIEPKGIKLLTTTFMAAQENLDFPSTCYAHFFMSTITAEGNLIFCKNARGENDFVIGNIYEKSLKEIWNDSKTREIESWVRPNNCGLFCKHMAINNAMEEIINPNAEDTPNFVG